jgi:hypothetical protein
LKPAILLSGLKAENPLAFLAALGILRLLSAHLPSEHVRMSWIWDRAWKAQIHTRSFTRPEELLEQLNQAGNSSPASIADFLQKQLLDYEDLTIPPHLFRELLVDAVTTSSQDNRFIIDAYAALGSDFHGTETQIADTALRTMSGAGHQHFLGSMRLLAEGVHAGEIKDALFTSWKYEQGWTTLRWDPKEDRRYALRATNPSKSPALGVPGANRLAFEALPLFPTFADSHRVITRCFVTKRRDTLITWPIWNPPIGLSTVETLLSHPELLADEPDESILRPLGVVELFRSARITVGKFRNFTPSSACWGTALAAAAGQ